jgi:serine/threonine-protein kinase
VVVALVAGGLALAATGTDSVAVPSVVGRTADQAERALDDAGLRTRTVARTADDPAGTVIGQEPSAGSYTEGGTSITLVVSRGPPKVDAPDLVGHPVGEATAALSQLGFAVDVQRRTDENVPLDAVIATDPPTPSALAKESKITLVVSDGPAPVRVPDVANGTYDAAAATLTQSRFTPTRAPDEFSTTVETGKVIRTDPVAGTLAPRGSSVAVVVSKGPELVAVPNTLGNSLETAQAKLQALGFEVDTQSYLPGRVVRSSTPAPGAMVPKGAKVTLTF